MEYPLINYLTSQEFKTLNFPSQKRPPRKANPVQLLQLEPLVHQRPVVQHGQFAQPQRPAKQPQRPPVRKVNSALADSALANSAAANSAFQRPKVQKGSFSISVFDNHGGSYDIRNSNNNNNSGGGVEVQNHGGIRFPNFQTQYGSVFHTQQT